MSTIFRPPQRVFSQKTPKKLNTYVEKPPFPTILAHRRCSPPFQNAIFSSSTHHPGLAGIVKKRNRRIRARISRKSVCGTATSAIWNTTYREWLTTLAPILISLALSVFSDHFFTDFGSAGRLRKLPRSGRETHQAPGRLKFIVISLNRP